MPINWAGRPDDEGIARPFRTRDKVSVHWGNGRVTRGRVICHNRRNHYGLSVVVLYEGRDVGGDEYLETFLPDGRRNERDAVFMTHGWEGDIGKYP